VALQLHSEVMPSQVSHIKPYEGKEKFMLVLFQAYGIIIYCNMFKNSLLLSD
jgi:hypothetical protein